MQVLSEERDKTVVITDPPAIRELIPHIHTFLFVGSVDIYASQMQFYKDKKDTRERDFMWVSTVIDKSNAKKVCIPRIFLFHFEILFDCTNAPSLITRRGWISLELFPGHRHSSGVRAYEFSSSSIIFWCAMNLDFIYVGLADVIVVRYLRRWQSITSRRLEQPRNYILKSTRNMAICVISISLRAIIEEFR